MSALAWSYIRLSTPDQIEGHGETRQMDAAAQYAKEHGLKLQPPLRDLGVSAFRGKNRTKGDLGRFLAMIEAGIVPKGSYFLVENTDRLSREPSLRALETFTAIINAGINVVTTDDKQVYNQAVLARDPMRLVMWVMQSIRGNSESTRKSDLVTRAAENRKADARAAGRAISGRVPTWLRKTPNGYEIDPVRGAVIERMFRELDAGLGSSRIAQAFNDEGIPPPNDYAKRQTRGWHHAGIIQIAKRRAAIGEHQMTKIEGDGDDQRRVPDGDPIPNFYPAVVTEDVFYRVQARIQERTTANRGGGKRGNRFSNLMGGVAKCSACGGEMTFLSGFGKTKAVMQCGNAKRKHGCTNRRRYEYTALETAILRFVSEVPLEGPKGRSAAESELEVLIARRDDVAKRIATLLDRMETDDADPELAGRLRERRIERNGLEEQIGAVRLRINEEASRHRPREHQDEIAAILAEMTDERSPELFNLRARLAVAFSSVIETVEFYPKGYQIVRLIADTATYVVTPEKIVRLDTENLIVTKADRGDDVLRPASNRTPYAGHAVISSDDLAELNGELVKRSA